MIRTWGLELRRSPGLWALPVLAALAVATMWTGSAYWVGDWHATSIQMQFPVVALAPIAAGLAAWAAGRGRRSRHAVITATVPRSAVTAAVVHWAALISWVLLAYLVELVVATARTGVAAVGGGPWSTYILLGAVALLAYSAIGYTLGALLPWRLVAPATALGVFGYFTAVATSVPWVGRWDLFHGDTLASPDQRVRTLVWVTQIVLGLTAVLAAFALIGVSSRGAALRRGIAAALILPLVAVVAGTTQVGTADFTRRPPPTHPVCAGHAPRVCAWPEHAKWVHDAVVVTSRLATALGAAYRFPPTVYEQGLLPQSTNDDTPVLAIQTLPVTQVSLIRNLTRGIVPARPTRCLTTGHPDLFDRYVLVQAWLEVKGAGHMGTDLVVDQARLQQILKLSTAAQRMWVHRSMLAIARCSTAAGASG